jgi:regulator of protease activity HflC (stomatin/prohibitin superfamily)
MFVFLALLCLPLIGCQEHVEPGYVGVIVSLSGDDKGVHEKVVGVGKYFIGWNEDLHLFPTFTKTYNWTKSPTEGNTNDESISFQTKEGTNVNGDFGITMSVNPQKAAILFQKYRRNVDEIIDSVLRNSVRDGLVAEASSMGIEQVMSEGKIGMIERVAARVQKQVAVDGINVEKISIIGDFRPPANIVEAINAKIQATQDAIRVENQLRQTEAEAKKTVMAARAQGEALLAQAEAEAKANRLLQESLSPNLISKMWIQKWDGALPTYSGANSMPTPMLNMGK